MELSISHESAFGIISGSIPIKKTERYCKSTKRSYSSKCQETSCYKNPSFGPVSENFEEFCGKIFELEKKEQISATDLLELVKFKESNEIEWKRLYCKDHKKKLAIENNKVANKKGIQRQMREIIDAGLKSLFLIKNLIKNLANTLKKMSKKNVKKNKN